MHRTSPILHNYPPNRLIRLIGCKITNRTVTAQPHSGLGTMPKLSLGSCSSHTFHLVTYKPLHFHSCADALCVCVSRQNVPLANERLPVRVYLKTCLSLQYARVEQAIGFYNVKMPDAGLNICAAAAAKWSRTLNEQWTLTHLTLNVCAVQWYFGRGEGGAKCIFFDARADAFVSMNTSYAIDRQPEENGGHNGLCSHIADINCCETDDR